MKTNFSQTNAHLKRKATNFPMAISSNSASKPSSDLPKSFSPKHLAKTPTPTNKSQQLCLKCSKPLLTSATKTSEPQSWKTWSSAAVVPWFQAWKTEFTENWVTSAMTWESSSTGNAGTRPGSEAAWSARWASFSNWPSPTKNTRPTKLSSASCDKCGFYFLSFCIGLFF